jgi:putative NADH-flavin reductase
MPGERTGKFRTAVNQLLTADNGKSYISMEDFAAGIIDEIENPMHIREIFTVGY